MNKYEHYLATQKPTKNVKDIQVGDRFRVLEAWGGSVISGALGTVTGIWRVREDGHISFVCTIDGSDYPGCANTSVIERI